MNIMKNMGIGKRLAAIFMALAMFLPSLGMAQAPMVSQQITFTRPGGTPQTVTVQVPAGATQGQVLQAAVSALNAQQVTALFAGSQVAAVAVSWPAIAGGVAAAVAAAVVLKKDDEGNITGTTGTTGTQ